MSQELIDAFVDMQEDAVFEIATKLLENGTEPLDILASANKALEVVGKRFEADIIFIPELILAGVMMKKLSEMLMPKIKHQAQAEKRGKVLMGTVEGDIHDIGKDMVTFMLEINGFEVLDLGVDVPAAEFVAAIERFQPQVVGLCGLLTLAYDPMKETVQAFEEAGLRDQIKIMVGGGQVNEEVCKYVKADAYGRDVVAAIELAEKWTNGGQHDRTPN